MGGDAFLADGKKLKKEEEKVENFYAGSVATNTEPAIVDRQTGEPLGVVEALVKLLNAVERLEDYLKN